MLKKEYKAHKSISIHKELESISEDLPKINISITHEVPEGYWEAQEASIMNKIKVLEAGGQKKNIVYKRIWYSLSVAATILALILIYPGGETSSESEWNLDSIELSALEEYLLDEAGSLDAKLSLDETFYDNELWNTEIIQTESNE